MAISIDASSTPHPPHWVRFFLVINSIIGVTFNIVMSAIARKKTEGVLGTTFLFFSGVLSLFQLACHNRRPVLTMFVDALGTVALGVLYILVLVLSYAIREHLVGAYANMTCLVSALLHGYAFSKTANHLLQQKLCCSKFYCGFCSGPAPVTADYKVAPTEPLEPQGQGNVALSDGRDGDGNGDGDIDERTPLYRDSEDTAVMAV